MANYKALRWAETVTTGKSGSRQLLDKLCEKADDQGRVWRETDEIARFCEMGYRTAVRHIDALEDLGLITQIRRIRPNASEAKPVILINYPNAAHLHGAVTVLDYLAQDGTGVRVMYPRDPLGLLTAGLRWSSNQTQDGVHPSHTDKVAKWLANLPAKLASGQPAKSASGASSENAENQQGDLPAKLASGQPAKSASGASSENAENNSSNGLPNWQGQSNPQPNHHPINQHEPSAGDERGEVSGSGWLDGDSSDERDVPAVTASSGGGNVAPFDETTRDQVRRKRARKLVTAIQDERPEWHPAMTEAEDLIVRAYAAGKTNQQIRDRLLASVGGVRNVGATITNRLRQLAPTSAERTPRGGQPARGDQESADSAFLEQLQA